MRRVGGVKVQTVDPNREGMGREGTREEHSGKGKGCCEVSRRGDLEAWWEGPSYEHRDRLRTSRATIQDLSWNPGIWIQDDGSSAMLFFRKHKRHRDLGILDLSGA